MDQETLPGMPPQKDPHFHGCLECVEQFECWCPDPTSQGEWALLNGHEVLCVPCRTFMKEEMA